MGSPYRELLDATINHLQDMRRSGKKWVNATPDTVRQLSAPAPKPEKSPTAAKSPTRNAVAGGPPTVSQPNPTAPLMPPATPQPKPSLSKSLAAALAAPAANGAQPSPSSNPAPAAPSSQPLSKAEKEAAMASLRQRVLACIKCPHLASSRTNVVFGVGDIHSPIMFVGEAPGADEDIQGEPFVGAAGQLLTRMIQTMGLTRSTVYIANILKCRPDTPGQSSGNRKPTTAEMAVCFPYLKEQAEIIRPQAIVALGVTAVEGLLGISGGIMKLRGNWQTWQGIPVMPTYHPAYLLRNQSITEKRKVWEDLMAVMQHVGMPISEKQRGFFLKAPGAGNA